MIFLLHFLLFMTWVFVIFSTFISNILYYKLIFRCLHTLVFARNCYFFLITFCIRLFFELCIWFLKFIIHRVDKVAHNLYNFIWNIRYVNLWFTTLYILWIITLAILTNKLYNYCVLCAIMQECALMMLITWVKQREVIKKADKRQESDTRRKAVQ